MKTLCSGSFVRLSHSLALAGTLAAVLLTGCGFGTQLNKADGPLPTNPTLHGSVHGGQQPVTGSQIYLYAVSTTATGGSATSLLNGPGYVLTLLDGSFSISNDYTCPANSYVYLVAKGGNPGLMVTPLTNPKIGLIAGLGACASLSPSTYFTINEVTTVAFAYALAGYATSETQVGSNVATDHGLQAGFINIPTYINPATGITLPDTVATAGSKPQETINSLANSISACINSDGNGSACNTLMSAANVTGANGTPLDTVQAALNIVRDPATSVATIFSLGPGAAVFQPTLTAAPANWTLLSPDPSMIPFFNGQTNVGGDVYSLNANGFDFGSYSYEPHSATIYDYDLGYEVITDAADSDRGIFLYDVSSTHNWYTTPALYPYIYDYGFQAFLYYFVGTSNPRVFYNYGTSSYLYW